MKFKIKFDIKDFLKKTTSSVVFSILIWLVLLSFIADTSNSEMLKLMAVTILALDVFSFFIEYHYSKENRDLEKKEIKLIIYSGLIEDIVAILLLGCYRLGIVEFIIIFLIATAIYAKCSYLDTLSNQTH